jgi:hypothetical protein
MGSAKSCQQDALPHIRKITQPPYGKARAERARFPRGSRRERVVSLLACAG